MNFLLTEFGIDWFDSNLGTLPELTEFRIGDGVNYIPNPTVDTDLRGNTLFVGQPGKPELTSTGEIKYLVFMDSSIGDFNWGEIGLFLNGNLFALGTTSAPVPKRKLTGTQEGNNTTIDAYLFPGSEYVVAELANSSNSMNVQVFNSLDRLPPAHQAQPNIYIIPNPTSPAKASLAFAAGGLWNVSGYEMAVYTASVISATANNLRLASDIDMPTEQGALLVGMISGPAAGLIRTAAAWDPATRVVTLSSPLQWTPQPGDLVHLARYTAVGSLAVYQLLEDLDPALTAQDLNQLLDLDTFFDPLVRRDGSSSMLANLNAGGHRVVNLSDPALSGDAATKGYVDNAIVNNGADLSVFLKKDGSVAMEGLLNLATRRVINLGNAVAQTDATNLQQVNGLIAAALSIYVRTDGTKAMTDHLVMDNHRIRLLANPVNGTDAVNLQTLTAKVNALEAKSLLVDGSQPMASTLNAGGFRVRNVGPATQPTDAATLNDVTTRLASYLHRDGSLPMTGPLAAGNFRIISVGDATQPTDAANLGQVLSVATAATADLLKQDGSRPLLGDVDANGFKITDLGAPSAPTDVATKEYVDTTASNLSSAIYEEVLLLDGSQPMEADLQLGGFKLTGVGTPTVNTDAATKAYVDAEVTSLSTEAIRRDGSNAATADLPIGGFKLTGVGDPTSAQDAATKNYVDTELLATVLADGSRSMTGNLVMGGNRITGLDLPVDGTDAANRVFVTTTIDTALGDYFRKDGSTALEGNVDLNGFKLVNVATPTDAADAVNKAYVDSAVSTDLTVFVLRDGSRPMTGDFNLDGNRVTGLPSAEVDPSDAVSYAGLNTIVSASTLLLDGSNAMSGNLLMDGNLIKDVGNPVDTTDAVNKQYVDGLEVLSLRRDGSRSMTAALDMSANKVVNVATPTDPADAATKLYVDTAIPNGVIGLVKADGSVPMSGPLDLGTSNRIVNLAAPQANTDAATKKYVDDVLPLVVLRNGSQAMSGDLVLAGNKLLSVGTPTNATDGANKSYVDAAVGAIDTSMFLPRDGTQFMIGHLNMGLRRIINLTDPVDPEDAATKSYVDGSFDGFLHRDGSLPMMGSFNFGGFAGTGLAGPTANTDAANKQYVDTTVAGSRTSLVTRDGTQGMNGPLDMGSNSINSLGAPVLSDDAATKGYVDGAVSGVTAGFVRANGTVPMTADLSIGGFKVVDLADPSADTDATNKQYVDGKFSGPVAVVTIDDPVYTLQAANAGVFTYNRLDGTTSIGILGADDWDVGTVFNVRADSTQGCEITSDTFTLNVPDGCLPEITAGGTVSLIVVSATEIDVFGSLERS